MKDDKLGYDPDTLMSACVQAAATVMAADGARDKAPTAEEIARFAAQIRDEALLTF